MATLPTLNDAIKAVIYKKVDDNGTIKYVPYFPRTDAEWVSLNESINIHGTSESANTDMETIVKALNNALGATNAAASSASTASLQAQITYAISKINEQTGAFIYKGNLTPPAASQPASPTADSQPGWVYNVSANFKINANGQIYASSDKDAYKAGTNIVVFIPEGTSTKKYDALGGDMGNHALTTEAIGYIGSSDGRFTWGYVSEGAATRTFGLPFTTLSDSLTSNYYLPLVYNRGDLTTSTVYISSGVRFTDAGVLDVTVSTANYADYADSADTANSAGTAAKVSVTATNVASSYYITFVSGTTGSQTVYVDPTTTPLTYNPNTNTINANISGNANSATTAGSVAYPFRVGPLSYNGSSTVTLNFTHSQGLDWYSVDGSSGLGVKLNSTGGLTHSDTGIKLSNTGIGSGTYSALQVDLQGRAVAGGQAIVFANSTSDPDLNQLVVGGLAFVSSSETAKTGTVPTNSIDLNN